MIEEEEVLAMMKEINPEAESVSIGIMRLVVKLEERISGASWINAAERQPAEWARVLVARDGAVGIGYWYGHSSGCKAYGFNNGSAVGNDFAFQYWQPLPASPKGIIGDEK